MVEMNEERYQLLFNNEDVELTPEELADGWHFCCEWDGLLLHPSWAEASVCACIDKALLDRYADVRKAGWPDPS